MQRNGSAADAAGSVPLAGLADAVVSPEQYGLTPVSPRRYCQMKPGAASRCLFSFEASDLDAATYKPEQQTYLVFSIDQGGQVAFDVHANELVSTVWDLVIGFIASLVVPSTTRSTHPNGCDPPLTIATLPVNRACWARPRTGLLWPSCS
jgi:hypothetical protein